MVKKCNQTKGRKDAYLKNKYFIKSNTNSDLQTALMNESTNLLMDCLFHVGGDASKLENEKRVTVVKKLMNESDIKKIMFNSRAHNIPESSIESLGNDLDVEVTVMAEV